MAARREFMDYVATWLINNLRDTGNMSDVISKEDLWNYFEFTNDGSEFDSTQKGAFFCTWTDLMQKHSRFARVCPHGMHKKVTGYKGVQFSNMDQFTKAHAMGLISSNKSLHSFNTYDIRLFLQKCVEVTHDLDDKIGRLELWRVFARHCSIPADEKYSNVFLGHFLSMFREEMGEDFILKKKKKIEYFGGIRLKKDVTFIKPSGNTTLSMCSEQHLCEGNHGNAKNMITSHAYRCQYHSLLAGI